MRHVLTTVADEAAASTGFVKRRRKLTGARFVQLLVLGWLGQPQAGAAALTRTAAALGVGLSRQGLSQRFGPPAAALLKAVLEAAVTQVVAAAPVAGPLLGRFHGVYVLDSSTVGLPAALAGTWPGCGGRTEGAGRAALKLGVELDLCTGALAGPVLAPGREQDRASALQHAAPPARSLRLTDLGFWSLDVFGALAAHGAFWLSRLNLQVVVFVDGERLDLPAWLAQRGTASVGVPVELGVEARLPARLLAARVPQAVADERRRRIQAAAQREGRTPSAAKLALAGWTLLVTNVPAADLRVAEALALARARWQIELLFKLWKQHGRIDETRSANPWAVLCELYAKLVAMVIQHWVLLVGCWVFADRSLVQGAAAVRAHAACLVQACRLGRVGRLVEALTTIRASLTAGCRIGRSRTRPSTHQLLADPALGGLA
jgi:hypothetical protein